MKNLKIVAFASMLIVTIVSVAFAAYLYTLTIPNQMSVQMLYELQLTYYGNDGAAVISNYNWGVFAPNQEKTMGVTEVFVRLWNLGTSPVSVAWFTTDFPTGWDIWIMENGVNWPQNTPVGPIPVDMSTWISIHLKHNGAEAGQSYAFGLNFAVP